MAAIDRHPGEATGWRNPLFVLILLDNWSCSARVKVNLGGCRKFDGELARRWLPSGRAIERNRLGRAPVGVMAARSSGRSWADAR